MKLREVVERFLGRNCTPTTLGEFVKEAEAALAEPVADEPVVDDLPIREALADECGELRIILSKVTQALGTGAFASSACSLHFLRMIPEEVKKTVDGLRATRPAPAPAERGEYPPLPDEDWRTYTADQMRAYVDADRAQRAKP